MAARLPRDVFPALYESSSDEEAELANFRNTKVEWELRGLRVPMMTFARLCQPRWLASRDVNATSWLTDSTTDNPGVGLAVGRRQCSCIDRRQWMKYGVDKEERAKLRTARAVMAPRNRVPGLHDVQFEWSADPRTDGLPAGHVEWTRGGHADDVDEFCAADDEGGGEDGEEPSLSRPKKGRAGTGGRGPGRPRGSGSKRGRPPKACPGDSRMYDQSRMSKWVASSVQPKREHELPHPNHPTVDHGFSARAGKKVHLPRTSIVECPVPRRGPVCVPEQPDSTSSVVVVDVATAPSRAPPPASPLSVVERGDNRPTFVGNYPAARYEWVGSFARTAYPPPVSMTQMGYGPTGTAAVDDVCGQVRERERETPARGSANTSDKVEPGTHQPRRGRRPASSAEYQAYVCPVGQCGGRYRGASGLYYHLRTQHPDYDMKKDGVRKHREAAL